MTTDGTTFHSPELCEGFANALRDHPQPGGTGDTEPWTRAILADALHARTTDIHLDPHENEIHVRFRIDGTVHDVVTLATDPGLRLLRYFKVNSDLDPAPSLTPQDARFHIELDDGPLDIRLSCAPCIFGDKLALRLLRRTPVTLRLADLGLNQDGRDHIRRWVDDISGMFLVAGPVGSGKTTTLYSLLAELELSECNIVTIEDPVEYELERINQMQVDEKRGMTFEECMRSVLRMDPDYVLLGEIRDQASAVAAMEAAGTGRVVLSTMHARNAAGVITSLRGLGISNHEIAASLGFVVAQRLVRKLCTRCRQQEPPTEAEKRWLSSIGEDIPDQAWHAPGCEHCGHVGYRERTGLFETLSVDEETYRLILANEDEHRLRRHLREAGFSPLLRDGLEKAAQGITDLSELTHIGAQSYLERSLRDAGTTAEAPPGQSRRKRSG